MRGKGQSASGDQGQQVRVLLADDEEMSRLGLSAALGRAPGIVVVRSGRAGAEARSSARTCRPDVVLLNAVNRADWVGTLRGILTDLPEPEAPRVIVMAGAEVDDRVPQAVHAGAAGVLLRDVSAEEVAYAVRQVAMGHAVVSPAATRWMLSRLRALTMAQRHYAGTATISMLSQREREILAGLAAGKSNQEIAAENHLALATVKSHVSNILAKLDVRDRVQAALIAHSAGIGSGFSA